MTVYKAMNMLLKEEKKGEKPKLTEKKEIANMFANVRITNANGIRKSCKTCGKIYESMCYIEYSELTSE